MSFEFEENIHYYLDGDRVVFTERWLVRKEKCCGNGCRHCPFSPKHQTGNSVVSEEFIIFKTIENGN